MLSLREHYIVSMLKALALSPSPTDNAASRPLVSDDLPSDNIQGHSATKLPTLAWVSPFPPQKTGVAQYSANIVAHLAPYFDVVPVYPDAQVPPQGLSERALLLPDFYKIATAFDCIVYNMGNSCFHAPIAQAAALFPGVVLMHDIYLGHCLAAREHYQPEGITLSILEDEGLGVLLAAQSMEKVIDTAQTASFVLHNARHIYVHSQYARNHLCESIHALNPDTVSVIPMCWHDPVNETVSKREARDKLGIPDNTLLLVTFGHINPIKGHAKIIEALSAVSEQVESVALRIVGPCDNEALKTGLEHRIVALGLGSVVKFVDYVDAPAYALHLRAADVALQLRDETRGESSAAVLDCLAAGLPTIVNDLGPLSELPDLAVQKVPAQYTIDDLASAIVALTASDKREALAGGARAYFDRHHVTANTINDLASILREQCGKAIETSVGQLAQALQNQGELVAEDELIDLAQAVSQAIPEKSIAPRLFVDVSSVEAHDLRTGIQRVVRGLTLALAQESSDSYRVVPVQLVETSNSVFAYTPATNFCRSLAPQHAWGADDSTNTRVLHPRAGDIVLCLDLTVTQLIRAEASGFYASLRLQGITIIAAVYDLLPISMPSVFPPGTHIFHEQWVRAIANFDRAVCISQHVASQLHMWLKDYMPDARLCEQGRIASWMLGSDIEAAQPTTGLLTDMTQLNATLASEHCFLMVGTIEPRKGYEEVLLAFENLWQRGYSLPLIIVGRKGWQHLPDGEREHIVAVCQLIERLAQQYSHIIWLHDASDELLNYVYKGASHTLCASYDEGFGLPIVEALKHQKCVIARDIPVFREVGGDAVHYWSWQSSAELADLLEHHMYLAPGPLGQLTTDKPPGLVTWAESASQLLDLI